MAPRSATSWGRPLSVGDPVPLLGVAVGGAPVEAGSRNLRCRHGSKPGWMAMSGPGPQTDLGSIAFSPDGEHWIEFGPPDDRRRIAFHDYASLYAVPGLYERVFCTELAMGTAERVVGFYAEALRRLGRHPGDERVVDLGAGNGLGGEQLRRIGVNRIVGIDLEPEARNAAHRDHPGVYDDYLVGDLTTMSGSEIDRLTGLRPTAVLALSALGPGHAPPAVIDRACGLMPEAGLFAFAVMPTLLPGSDDPLGQRTGYPEFLAELFTHRADELARHDYVHRQRTDGTDDLAVALVGQLR